MLSVNNDLSTLINKKGDGNPNTIKTYTYINIFT